MFTSLLERDSRVSGYMGLSYACLGRDGVFFPECGLVKDISPLALLRDSPHTFTPEK